MRAKLKIDLNIDNKYFSKNDILIFEDDLFKKNESVFLIKYFVLRNPDIFEILNDEWVYEITSTPNVFFN